MRRWMKKGQECQPVSRGIPVATDKSGMGGTFEAVDIPLCQTFILAPGSSPPEEATS